MTLPAPNVTIEPRAPHLELLDPRTADVWLCQQPLSAAQFRDFRPEPPLMKSGYACGAMDAAHFLRSPGATADGPLETRAMGGHTFARVARPLKFRGLAPGDAPTRVVVEKHHVLGFAAGALVRVAQLPDGGLYVQQTAALDGTPVATPADWKMLELRAEASWSLTLPTPTTVWFFRNLTSFAGPLAREQLPF